MKINKWLESSLFKEYIQDVVSVSNIYFFTDAPIPVVDIESTSGNAYWTANSLDSLVLLNINLTPTESWDINSTNDNLDITLTWSSTNRYTGVADGIANWFLMTDASKNVLFMGEVSGPEGSGDMKISDNNIVTGQKYKIYKYVMTYNQV